MPHRLARARSPSLCGQRGTTAAVAVDIINIMRSYEYY